MSLWDNDDCAAWHQAAEQYTATIQAQQVNGLAELDTWYRAELPALLAARQPAALTPAELERVTAWKMKRGVWRERNRLLVAGNAPAAVEQASRAAFAAVPDLRRPVTLLSGLAGVGPATASAVLAAYRPAVYPFFDELVARQVPGLGAVSFTAAYYQRYAALLRERAARLAGHCPHHPWTAQDLSQALWAASGGKAAAAL
ncbi:MAG TPA: hypothetical protein VKY74_11300 [Chloroflexia bacterium]|nr:hypothetical protein [Chloroflexia bacterium]